MKDKKVLIGYTFVILSGILFGSMHLMADFIYSEGVNSLSLVFWRNILSIPAFLNPVKASLIRVFISAKEKKNPRAAVLPYHWHHAVEQLLES